MKSVFRAVRRNASASDMGFAGAAGLFASGLTDIASSLGPFLPWFCFVMAAGLLLFALLIDRYERQRTEGAADPPRVRAYSQAFSVLLGGLFGSVVLMIAGFLAGDTSGSSIISIANDIRSGVERVEEGVERVEDKVDQVSVGVDGLGESMSIRDVTGRSGTGKIGDVAIFEVSLANERLMQGAQCRLSLPAEWRSRVEQLDDACDTFTIRLPVSPVVDDDGHSLGDIVPVPFELSVVDADENVIASYSDSYPLHNNYGTVRIRVEPAGNRWTVGERRRIRVDVGDAELPDSVECEWTAFEPVSIEPTSPNGCEAALSTAVDRDAYVYKRLLDEGRIRDEIYVQLNTAADFTMLGNATFRYAVTPD